MTEKCDSCMKRTENEKIQKNTTENGSKSRGYIDTVTLKE